LTEKRKADALEVADRQKNEFLAMLAHELRNPLAPIGNGLQLLTEPGIDVKETAELMQRQFFHLVRLVDDLLDVSRIITGKLTFRKEPVELVAIINRAVEETQPAIDSRGHELILTLPARPLIVDADAHRLSQVISNLLVNAGKYTDKPSQIRLLLERQGNEAVLRVIDSGDGIEPALLPKIFNLFVQADHSLARSQGGLGIGLTVVKRIVEMHGGNVTALSVGKGQGSEFVVRLPLSKAASAATKPAGGGHKSDAPKRSILVVDDNVDAAMTITSLLKAWGHDVRTAFNGPSALAAVQNHRPEIILLDIGLPGMSGYDVARSLRAEPSSRGVIIAALTGYGQDSDLERSVEAGFDYHITKPADPDILESLLTSPMHRAAQGLPIGRFNSSQNN
jgi:CheY-like chemotaxis protein/two-component sensor histidine kinase